MADYTLIDGIYHHLRVGLLHANRRSRSWCPILVAIVRNAPVSLQLICSLPGVVSSSDSQQISSAIYIAMALPAYFVVLYYVLYIMYILDDIYYALSFSRFFKAVGILSQ